MAERKCIRCGETKPRTSEFFSPRPDRGPDSFHTACRDCRRIAQREQRRANPSLGRKYFQNFKRNNPKAYEARRKRSYAKTYADPAKRIGMLISARVTRTLRGRRKHRPTYSALGYTMEELREHLERQFLRGMTWDNYGSDWHIDHIVPLSSFNYTSLDDDEFRAAWALTNLRPLWARENVRKNATRTHLI